jgi:tRNA threonylcarbamoyladenosine biosynthesis protein TsaE
MQWRITNEHEYADIAGELLARVHPQSDRATVVTLMGTLGAGKTTLVRAIARQLGIREHIKSPTFIIESRYTLVGQTFDTLVHIDAYRLDAESNLSPLRLDDTCAMPRTLVLIEWPEHIASAVPQNALQVAIDIEGEERVVRVVQ